MQAGQATQSMQPSEAVQRGTIDPAAQAAKPSSTAPREMTLVTLNLHHDREDWPARRAYIATELKQLAPDVIALQEVIER
ncbi:endonuclease, partial [Xanthomonas vasicola]